MIRRIRKAILEIGDKRGLCTVLACAGCLAAVLGTAVSAGLTASADTEASAETEEKYEAPRILCPEADGAEGWYQTAPAVRIIHTDPNTVTRYMAETASGNILEGELRLEEEGDSEEKDEESGEGESAEGADTEEQEGRGTGDEESEEQASEDPDEEDQGSEAGEEAQAVKELPADIWEEGENHLTVWMERIEEAHSDRDESGTEEVGSEGEEVYRSEMTILFDGSDPGAVQFSYPAHPDDAGLYFQSGAEIMMTCEDSVSGIREIICTLEDGTEKRLDGDQAGLVLPAGYMGSITAVAVDRAGRSGEKSISKAVICEDEPPAILISAAGGMGIWHQGSAEVNVLIGEPGEKYGFSSGLASAACYVEGKPVQQKAYLRDGMEKGHTVTEDAMHFTVETASAGGNPIQVTVFAADRSGNTSVRTEELYIDAQAPDIQITGLQEKMITGEAVHAGFTVTEENVLRNGRLTVWRTDAEGNRSEVRNEGLETWSRTEQGIKSDVVLEEDGIYDFSIWTEDMAGHRTEKNGVFTIDRTSPVIRYVDQLNGTYMRFFCWNYGREEMVRDFTEYTYQMHLDGRPYFSGRYVTEEGNHLLEVRAQDAAGNQSYAKAVFMVDHTPPQICWGELQNGSVYEESVLLSIWVDGEGERLKTLAINGERQKLSAGSRIFQYEVTENGMYTVEVEADDLTGNETEERITFEVREKAGLAEKIIRPVSRVLGGEEDVEEKETPWPVFLLTAVCTAAGCAALGRKICRARRR